MESKAVIQINAINPMLFSFVEELNEVKVNEPLHKKTNKKLGQKLMRRSALR